MSARIRKLAKLPDPIMLEVITTIFPTWPQDAGNSTRIAFLGVLHIIETTPMPANLKLLFTKPLADLCKQQYQHTGNMFPKRNFSDNPPVEKDFVYFTIAGTVLTFVPKQLTVQLPVVEGTDYEWEFDDAFSLSAKLVSKKVSAMQFKAMDFFPDALAFDPCEAWAHELAAPDESDIAGVAASSFETPAKKSNILTGRLTPGVAKGST